MIGEDLSMVGLGIIDVVESGYDLGDGEVGVDGAFEFVVVVGESLNYFVGG